MAAARTGSQDEGVRMPTALTVVAAGGAALAFGALAVGAAMAVPDRPAAAHVEGYVQDLEASPPPAASAAILNEATGDTIPSAPATIEDEDDLDELEDVLDDQLDALEDELDEAEDADDDRSGSGGGSGSGSGDGDSGSDDRSGSGSGSGSDSSGPGSGSDGG